MRMTTPAAADAKAVSVATIHNRTNRLIARSVSSPAEVPNDAPGIAEAGESDDCSIIIPQVAPERRHQNPDRLQPAEHADLTAARPAAAAGAGGAGPATCRPDLGDRKSTRLNSSH